MKENIVIKLLDKVFPQKQFDLEKYLTTPPEEGESNWKTRQVSIDIFKYQFIEYKWNQESGLWQETERFNFDRRKPDEK